MKSPGVFYNRQSNFDFFFYTMKNYGINIKAIPLFSRQKEEYLRPSKPMEQLVMTDISGFAFSGIPKQWTLSHT